jgi:hypothetical protein
MESLHSKVTVSRLLICRRISFEPQAARDSARLLALDAAQNCSLSGYRERFTRRRTHHPQCGLVSLSASRASRRHPPSIFLPIPCVTAVLRTFSKQAPTCVPFRSYSDIPDWSTLSSTYISRPSICRRSPIPSIPWKSPASITSNVPGGSRKMTRPLLEVARSEQ